jgi:UDP-glucose 4-epimerase
MNLAFWSRVTLLEVIAELETIIGHPLEVELQPTRAGDVPPSQPDTARLRSLFPNVEPVHFVTGLAATVDWFRSLN